MSNIKKKEIDQTDLKGHSSNGAWEQTIIRAICKEFIKGLLSSNKVK